MREHYHPGFEQMKQRARDTRSAVWALDTKVDHIVDVLVKAELISELEGDLLKGDRS